MGKRLINWFEIPVADMARAKPFHEAMLGVLLRSETMGPQTMAVFAYSDPATGGALLQGPNAPRPGPGGTLAYLDAVPDLDRAVARARARARAAGAEILVPRFDLPDGMGCFAKLLDLHGNRIGLHALS